MKQKYSLRQKCISFYFHYSTVISIHPPHPHKKIYLRPLSMPNSSWQRCLWFKYFLQLIKKNSTSYNRLQYVVKLTFFREAAKKSSSLNGRASEEKKKIFLEPFFQRSQISTAIKLEGRRGVRPNGPAIKRRTFFAASLRF